MRRSLLMCLLFLAGCSKGPQADLQYIAGARSLAAEWAMVNEQQAKGRLTGAYVGSMHKSLREQAQTAYRWLGDHDSDYAREIQALIAAGTADQMELARLKKRKLRLKDQIQQMASSNVPDIIA